jgi:hypothetical protein
VGGGQYEFSKEWFSKEQPTPLLFTYIAQMLGAIKNWTKLAAHFIVLSKDKRYVFSVFVYVL